MANLINSENYSYCLHEGKFREREVVGNQLLPFLTLENRLAYEYPERAAAILSEKRSSIREAIPVGARLFGDIAYNYLPFLGSINDFFPTARFLLFIRNGKDFVRSATVLQGEDETPVGWAPQGKSLTELEQYIALGRIQPRETDPLNEEWNRWDAFQKNTWLWTESNRLLISALDTLEPEKCHVVRFETFMNSKLEHYQRVREFLGMDWAISQQTQQLLEQRKINARRTYDLPEYSDWTKAQRDFFWQIAGTMMERLNYE